jgi:hypothetical protein
VRVLTHKGGERRRDFVQDVAGDAATNKDHKPDHKPDEKFFVTGA